MTKLVSLLFLAAVAVAVAVPPWPCTWTVYTDGAAADVSACGEGYNCTAVGDVATCWRVTEFLCAEVCPANGTCASNLTSYFFACGVDEVHCVETYVPVAVEGTAIAFLGCGLEANETTEFEVAVCAANATDVCAALDPSAYYDATDKSCWTYTEECSDANNVTRDGCLRIFAAPMCVHAGGETVAMRDIITVVVALAVSFGIALIVIIAIAIVKAVRGARHRKPRRVADYTGAECTEAVGAESADAYDSEDEDDW